MVRNYYWWTIFLWLSMVTFRVKNVFILLLSIITRIGYLLIILYRNGPKERRCTRLRCPRLDCPPACLFAIRVILTPYRFIPWPLWPMLKHCRLDILDRGHLSQLHRVPKECLARKSATKRYSFTMNLTNTKDNIHPVNPIVDITLMHLFMFKIHLQLRPFVQIVDSHLRIYWLQ